MDRYGYRGWDRQTLPVEAARLKGAFEQLAERLDAERENLRELGRDVERGWWGTGVGAILAVAGFVVGATTPLGLFVIFGSAGLTYWSGKNSFEASARCNDKDNDLSMLVRDFEEIAERLEEIEQVLRTQ
jgi:hypothetical protein